MPPGSETLPAMTILRYLRVTCDALGFKSCPSNYDTKSFKPCVITLCAYAQQGYAFGQVGLCTQVRK